MNYYDILLAKKLEDNRDPQVVGLSVTENGTYSEEGKVYKPVVVNVPLPSNAYLLQTIEHESIATFADGTDNFLKSLEVAIEPIQSGSGDPSPENIRPISGWDECNVTRTGKNLWGGEKLADDIVSKVPNASKDTINKTVTYTSTDIKDVILFEEFKPNTQYSFLLSTDSIYTNIAIIYTDGTWQPTISNQICVSDASKTVARLVGIWSSGTTDLKYDECGVFEGVITGQDFEPYNGHTYTINLDGTRYGGKVDLVNGVLTVTHVVADLGDLNWTYNTIIGNHPVFTTQLADSISFVSDSNIICSQYVTSSVRSSSNATVVNAMNDKEIAFKLMSKQIFIYDSAYTDATTFKTAMDGVQLVYELATPIVIQLTPTIIKSLQGDNNFFASTGEIELLQYFGKETA